MSGPHRKMPRLTALLGEGDMTPDLVARLVTVAYLQAQVAYMEVLDVVVPRLPPLKRGYPLRVAARMDGDLIFEESFLEDLGALISSLETEIEAGSHAFWHDDENHSRGGHEAVFREPGVTDFQHAVTELSMLRDSVIAAICAAKGLRNASGLINS